MDSWKRQLSRATFAGVTLVTEASNRSGLPVVSTGRPFSFYREVFFDNRSAEEVLTWLKGHVVVDVGCGLTPYTPDSMFQACWQAGVPFYGVDPKLGGNLKLGTFDRLKVAVTLGSGLDPDAPGAEHRIAAMAHELPFEDRSVDLILSSWFLFAWVRHPEVVQTIFTEFHRVLRPGGQVRVYPTPHKDSRMFDCIPQGFEISQDFRAKTSVLNMPPAFVTTFTRK